MSVLDVIVVGAGPAGLATAIAARQRGLSCIVLERGVLVNTIFNYPTHMVFFTTPELLEVGSLPFVTPHDKPTRFEALRYYRKVVDHFGLDIHYEEEVVRVFPDVFAGDTQGLSLETRSRRGVRRVLHARTVVLASGAYDAPNRVGVPGEDLPHVSHYYREAHPYYRKQVVIVGGANSAAEAALDLYRNGAVVTLVHRRAQFSSSIKYWVRPDLENRIREGSITAHLETSLVEIRPTEVVVERGRARTAIPAEAVLLLTGYRVDPAFFERVGVHYDPDTLAPVFDAETFESNVAGLFLAGAVTTGINSGKIFIENGRFHGERVIEVISARLRERALAPTSAP
jgi:thioredoxin reductase (NADPH)